MKYFIMAEHSLQNGGPSIGHNAISRRERLRSISMVEQFKDIILIAMKELMEQHYFYSKRIGI